MRAFWIYIIGTILLIAGVGYALYALNVPNIWIGVTILVIAGIGIASGAGLSKKKSSDTNGNAGTTNVNVESPSRDDSQAPSNPPREPRA